MDDDLPIPLVSSADQVGDQAAVRIVLVKPAIKTGGVHDRWHQVHGTDAGLPDDSGGQDSGVVHDQREAGGFIVRNAHPGKCSRAIDPRPSVLGGEDDECVVEYVGASQRINHSSDLLIERRDRSVVLLMLNVLALIRFVEPFRRVVRLVRRVIRLVQEKRPVSVLFDKLDRSVGLNGGPVGGVEGLADPMVKQRVETLPDVKEPGVPFSEMPLANVRGAVAGVIEEVREVGPQVESRIGEWIGNRFLIDIVRTVRYEGIRVLLHPVLVRILAGENRGATGAAQRLRGVAIVEPDAGRGQLIDPRRVDIRATICADGVSAALVKQDEQEVRRVLAIPWFRSGSSLSNGPLGRRCAPE